MGQVLKKIGSEENNVKEIGPVIEKCYDEYFVDSADWSAADFFHAVCKTVEEINKTLGSTQFRVPSTETLEEAYNRHRHEGGKPLTKEDFQAILQELIYDTGVTGVGAKDMLLYTFGVPITTLFIKQRLIPKAIRNEFFIPLVTSATVFALAKFNKL